MLSYPDNYASLFIGGLGLVCVLFGVVCLIAAIHWRLDKVGYWWAWLGPSLFFPVVGCLMIWRS